MSLQRVLQIWREEIGYSQRDMAAELNVSQQVYSYYEKGRSKPGKPFYERFQTAFGWDLNEAVRNYSEDPFAVNKRLLSVLKVLVNNKLMRDIYELAFKIVLDVPRYKQMLEGALPVFPEFVRVVTDLEYHYFVSRAYLLFDAPPVFLADDIARLEKHQLLQLKKISDTGLQVAVRGETKMQPEKEEWTGVPMYDIPVTAGAVSLIRDERTQEPAYYLQIPGFKDCTFGARVSGDSMYPEIRNGDYVVCKELQTLESLIYGDIYLVITKDGMETVKYVHPHEEREDWIKLVPYNKSVPVTPMPKSNIFKVYKVKGVLKGY